MAVPDEHVGDISYAARLTSYGWGCVPVEARIGGTDFTTSLLPRGETYLLPVKVAVQRTEQIGLGNRVQVTLYVRAR